MSWRETFSIRFGPGTLAGITLGRWLRVLQENRFGIDLPYWGRAATITLGAIANAFLGWWENQRHGRAIRDARILPPLFVLGIWRSGTTHLHNLLAQDVLKVSPWSALQRPDHSDLDDRTIRQYREVYDVFFEERGLIPKAHFHEVGFEALEKDPLGQVRAIYEALDLPDYRVAEPALRRYALGLAGYRKNVFPELPADLRGRIAKEWRRCFEEWGYPV